MAPVDVRPRLCRACAGQTVQVLRRKHELWGTDSIWYGSLQDHIQAFRTSQIFPAFRDKFGYPQITKELRANVFGLNALNIYPVPADALKKHISGDKVTLERAAYQQRPEPNFATYLPKTRREFLNLKRWEG